MSESSNSGLRERPLAEVKSEITRRGGHLNPLDGIHPADAEQVKNEEIATMITDRLKLRRSQ